MRQFDYAKKTSLLSLTFERKANMLYARELSLSSSNPILNEVDRKKNIHQLEFSFLFYMNVTRSSFRQLNSYLIRLTRNEKRKEKHDVIDCSIISTDSNNDIENKDENITSTTIITV